MSVPQRFCQVAGHEIYIAKHLCTFRDCNQYSRWVCPECSFKKLHLHQQQQNNHIMNFQKFKNFLNQIEFDDLKLKELEFKQQLKMITQMIKYMMSLMQSVEQLHQKLEGILSHIEILKNFTHLTENDFHLMDSELINETLKQKDTINMKQIIENEQENILNICNGIQKLKDFYFEKQKQQIHHQVEQLNNYITEIQQNMKINSASISYNQQYLAFGGLDKIFIFDINKNRILQQLKLDNFINVCTFSKDSQLLYVGSSEGHILCIDLQDNYKIIYSEQLYLSNVNSIIEQQNSLILSCSYQDIIITDIKQKIQILRIENVHNNHIFTIDYNEVSNLIASGSQDQSIKIFSNQTGQVILEKCAAHSSAIDKIQFINKNRLLSLEVNHFLKLWKIDLESKELVFVNYLFDVDKITNFRYLDDKSIILVGEQFIKIVDEEFNQTSFQQQPQVNHIVISEISQFESHYYIVIPPKDQITIIKRQ